ncbi:MAG: hypothetical protein HQL23_00550 [Candidatus Omnitrophica bacterium]|nr:hypothetical protein [Candidatus Omnitrophota bacterium]
MVRMNITMPDRIAQKLSNINNKSRFIAEAVEEKIDTQEKQILFAALSQEYKQMSMRQKTFIKDWQKIETEGWE